MSRSETMARPVHGYEPHHTFDHDDINRSRDRNFGNKVSRLKNVFQSELETKLHDTNNHIGHRLGFAGQRSPEAKRKRGPDTNDPASPVTKSQRSPDTDPSKVDPNLVDPQKFFETTNHVQRFQYTRAIFAKMEEQNRKELEKQRVMQRKISPSRERAISPTSPTPGALNHQRSPPPPRDRGNKPPVDYANKPIISYLTKPRSSSDPTKMEKEADRKSRLHGDGEERLVSSKRSESVDTLLSEVTDTVPTARWIRQKYEEEAKKQTSTHSARPTSRFSKPIVPPKEVGVKEMENSNHTAPSRGQSDTTVPLGKARSLNTSVSCRTVGQRSHSQSDITEESFPNAYLRRANSEEEKNSTTESYLGGINHDDDSAVAADLYLRRAIRGDRNTKVTNSYPRQISGEDESTLLIDTFPSRISCNEESLSVTDAYPSRINHEEESSSITEAYPSRISREEESLSITEAYPSRISREEESSSITESYPSRISLGEESSSITEAYSSSISRGEESSSVTETYPSRKSLEDERTSLTGSYPSISHEEESILGPDFYPSRVNSEEKATTSSTRSQHSVPKVETNHSETVHTERTSVTSTETKEDDIPSWRRRLNRPTPSTSTGTSSTATPSSSGVLLPKRRSREDSSLSKEEIAASLNEADCYWQKMYGEAVPETIDSSKMTDSTYSSGSGEEMARSDSGHELTEVNVPTSPTSPTSPGMSETVVTRRSTAWKAKYQAQRRSRGSDSLDEKVTLGELNSRRSSHGSGSGSGSNRGSDNYEEKIPDVISLETTTNFNQDSVESPLASPISRSSSENSSLPSVVKRLSTIDDPDIMNAPPSYPSPPMPPVYLSSPEGAEPDVNQEVSLEQFIDETDTDHILDEEYEDQDEDVQQGDSDVVMPLETSLHMAHLTPGLGIKKTASPNESIDSMTPSEQDNFLAKVDEDVLNLEDKNGDGFLHEREDGDGHEQPETAPDLMDGAVPNSLHMLDDGSYFFEVAGLPTTDHDDHLYPNAKPASRVKFSVMPIKVFSTYSVEDYDRKNEDVDPMAASAEYELEKRVERMDVFPVELEKGPEGLGLSIIGMGVGADAGLEKLGIFIKTLTEGGAAARDNRIKVNDQIIEVDGKSLVGVTQAYAASVLRNTSGTVKFLIGREKDPQKSEVARLIQQSIEQDRRRAEMRQREQDERHREQEDLERRQQEMAARKHELEQELAAQERLRHLTNNGMPPPLPEIPPPPIPAEIMDLPSPEDGMSSPGVEVFDLPEDSSSDGVTPEMDAQVLFIKLKEAQYKNAVSEAELAKVKAKIILLENAESQRKHYEKKCEDMAQRLRESERHLQGAQKDVAQYQEILEKTQGSSKQVEENFKEEYTALEKKYQKAKKLIKEYQQRERDLVSAQEAHLHQQAEKDQQYNALIKSLKDTNFQLERDLEETLKVAGLPPKQESSNRDLVIPQPVVPLTRPQMRHLSTDLSEISDDEEGSPDYSPGETNRQQISKVVRPVSYNGVVSAAPRRPAPSMPTVNGSISPTETTKQAANILNAVPETPLLDTSANKSKAQLVKSGSLANRNPPSKASSHTSSQDDDEDDDPFLRHDSDSTVRKNNKKKKTPVRPEVAPPDPPRPLQMPLEKLAEGELEGEPEALPVSNIDDLDSDSLSYSENSDHIDRDAQSDSSSVSQSSYDPSKPMFSGMSSEIPDSLPMGMDDSGEGIMLLSSKPRLEAASGSASSAGLFGRSSSKPSSGGVTLGSNRTPNSFGSTDTGGITLLASRPLNIDYAPNNARESNTTLSSYGSSSAFGSSSAMVTEYDVDSRTQTYDFTTAMLTSQDDEGMSSGRPTRGGHGNQYQTSPVPEWSVQQVCHWLLACNMDHYAPEFTAKAVDGSQLLQLDSNKLKALGVSSSSDRAALKKRIKDLKAAIDKERKQQEKEQRARDKLEKQSSTKKKKFPFVK